MLDEKVKGLIAVGASITANCQSCLEVRAAKARELGATDAEILAAIEVGKQIRAGAAGKMDHFASNLADAAPPAKTGDCCC